MKPATAVCLGTTLSLLVFAYIMQFTDTNDYTIKHIDPKSGLRVYTPNSSHVVSAGCFENVEQINNIGFHGPFVPLEKEKDTFRIIIIGNSYIESQQVGVEEMYSTLLQNKLNAIPNRKYTYEVIPMGVNGDKSFLNALYYVSYGSVLKPDLVIDFETQYELAYSSDEPTDLQGNVILQAPKFAVENPTKVLIMNELRRSKLLVNLYNRYLVFRDNITTFLAHPFFFIPQRATALSEIDPVAQNAAHWRSQDAIIGALAQRVRSDGARLLVALWFIPGADSWFMLGADASMKEFPFRFGEMAARHRFSYANLTPAFSAEEEAEGSPASWSCDIHWTPAGNRYMASALYTYLSTHPELLTR